VAAFGHVEFPISDTLRLVTGARWTDDRKKLDGESVDAFGSGIPVLLNRAQLGSAVDVSYGNWQAKAQVEWRPAPETLYFLGVSRGTKAGGFQGRMDPANLTFDQEVLTNYEGGFKITALNDSLRLNGSVFYYDYKDYQAFEFNQTSLATTIQNLPARVKGAELELYARPARPLEIGLGVSVLDTVAKGVVLPGGAIVDRDMPQSPGVSVNGLARYTVPVRSGSVALQVDFKYNGGYYFTVNNAPVEREPAYTIGNVRLSYESADGRWSAGAFVTNVLDKEYRVYSLDVSGLGFSNDRPGVPRWFGINVGYRLVAP
jgi:iron complex outermembrane receptor protein